jgi:hypothetical protein
MKQQHDVSIHSRMVKWSLLTTTRGLSPVWVSFKAYDAAAARLLRAARGGYGKELLKTRSAPLGVDLGPMRTRLRRASSTTQDSCGYVTTPDLLTSVRGLAQVWVSAKVYDALAAGVVREAKGKYSRRLLRQRMAPLGLNARCEGSCYGGWCREKPVPPDEEELSATASVCECDYYV